MAPTYPVAGDPTQLAGTTAPLAALGQPARLPDAEELATTLVDQLHAGVARARELRGQPTQPEDTHHLIRDVHTARAAVQDLIAHLGRVVDACDAVLLEELAAAVGVNPSTGQPRRGMRVPLDSGETLNLSLEWETEYRTDLDQLVRAATRLTEAQRARDGAPAPEADPLGFAMEAVLFVVLDVMRKSVPKSRGVEATAVTLGALGLDDVAAVARGAHQPTSRTFKRLKVEATTPLQDATRPPAGAFGRRRTAAPSA